MSATEFFLTQRLPRDHKWEWYVLDREGLHQDILQILFNTSPIFTHTFLGLNGTGVRCVRQHACFDLRVQSDADELVYIEIKVDQPWRSAQQVAQIAFLEGLKSNVSGVLVLLSNCAIGLRRSEVEALGKGLFSKKSYTELYSALDAVTSTDERRALCDLAAAYKVALREQEMRTLKKGDPNL